MSGTGYIGKTTNTDGAVTASHAQASRDTTWGEIDGEVIDYDAAKGTATIRPIYKPIVNGNPVDMPDLMEVPIRFQRSGKGGITFPVPAGTKVRLRPGMRSSENYHSEGTGDPSDRRTFNLSDMEADITGGESLTDPMPNVDPDNLHIRGDAQGLYGIKLSADGKFQQEGSQGNVYGLVADAVDLCKEGFDLLATEPELIHVGQYAQIGAALGVIVGKLNGMRL